MNETWHIITPEYPPQIGGVSDYTYQVAAGLRAEGDAVHVWCAGERVGSRSRGCSGTDCVHWLREGIGPAGLKRLTRQLDRFPASRRLLVQWLPHGYGWKSMNVPFCLWLWNRARRGDRVEIMLHEPFLQFREGNLKQDAAALVHRAMTILLLRAASQVWMSTALWEPMWRPYCLGKRIPFAWLPIPAIEVQKKSGAACAIRQRYAPLGETVIGHFSMYGKPITRMLDGAIPAILRGHNDRVLMLIGQGGERYRLQLSRAYPDLAGRVFSTGSLDAEPLSSHLLACDLLLQPYADGINARRGSALAGLAHGVGMVSTSGPMTEEFWKTSGALALASLEPGDIARVTEQVLGEPALTGELGRRAKAFYDKYFDARHMIRALRTGVPEREYEKAACYVSD